MTRWLCNISFLVSAKIFISIFGMGECEVRCVKNILIWKDNKQVVFSYKFQFNLIQLTGITKFHQCFSYHVVFIIVIVSFDIDVVVIIVVVVFVSWGIHLTSWYGENNYNKCSNGVGISYLSY